MPVTVNANDCKGHIFFYDFEKAWGESEIQDDYWLYYAKVKDVLPEKGISFSLHHYDKPLKSVTCFGKKTEIDNKNLTQSIGYVFIKPGNEIKYINGVLTDVDILEQLNAL